MSWAIFSMISKLGAIEGLAAPLRLQAFARASSPSSSPTTPC